MAPAIEKEFDFLICLDVVLHKSPGIYSSGSPADQNDESSSKNGPETDFDQNNNGVSEINWRIIQSKTQEAVETRKLKIISGDRGEDGGDDDCEVKSSLQEAVKTLDRTLFERFMLENRSYCFVTAEKNIFAYDFQYIAAQEEVTLQAHFERYFDILAEFNTSYPQTTTKDLNDIFIYLFPRRGNRNRMHSEDNSSDEEEDDQDQNGQDSSENHSESVSVSSMLARVVQKMLQDGHKFTSPEYVQFNKDAVDAEKTNERKETETASGHMKSSSKRKAEEGWADGGGGGGEAAKLPRTSSEKGSEYAASEREEVGGGDAEGAGGRGREGKEGEQGVYVKTQWLRLRGLPWEVDEAMLVDFLKDTEVARSEGNTYEDSIYIQKNVFGQPTGTAFVKFASRAATQRAKETKNKAYLGNRYVEVFLASPEEVQHTKSADERRKATKLSNPHIAAAANAEPSSHIIKLRGLPWRSTPMDILNFFSDIQIDKDRVHIIRHPDGRDTGECFVQLNSAEDVSVALQKHNERLGQRYIEVFRTSQPEMLARIEWSSAFSGSSPASSLSSSQFSPSSGYASSFGGGGHRAHAGPGGYGGYNNNNVYNGQQQYQQQYQPRSAYAYGRGRGAAFAGGRGGGGGRFGRFDNTYRHSGDAYNATRESEYNYYGTGAAAPSATPANSYHESGYPSQSSGPPCLRLRGLPWEATEEDIIAFFSEAGARIAPGGVQIVGGRDGRPSGTGFIVMASEQDAACAMQKHYQRMHRRYIEIFRSSAEDMYAQTGVRPDPAAPVTSIQSSYALHDVQSSQVGAGVQGSGAAGTVVGSAAMGSQGYGYQSTAYPIQQPYGSSYRPPTQAPSNEYY